MAEEIYSPDPLMAEQSLEEWVVTKCENWRDYYESNYEESFEEYYRLWRGQCCLLYTSPSPRDVEESRMPSSA